MIVKKTKNKLVGTQNMLRRQKKYATLANAGWSSLEARLTHNQKAVGSNPTPATNIASRRGAHTDCPKIPLLKIGIFRTVWSTLRRAKGHFGEGCSSDFLNRNETRSQN